MVRYNKPTRSKYNVDQSHAGKLQRTFNGILFDSLLEMNRYIVLLSRAQSGTITNLSLQPAFELQPKFVDAMGNRQRAISYTADFLYQAANGALVVEEVKGKETPDFRLRSRLFLYKYPDYIYRIITAQNLTE